MRLLIVLCVVAVVALGAPWWASRQPTQETPTQAIAADRAELAAIPIQAPLSLIVEPDDGLAPITNVIASASSSIDLVIYELEDPDVEAALAAAQARGVAVRVMLDNLNSFGRHPNQPAYDYLQAHHVPVEWSPAYFTLTHQKTLIVDNRTALVMTFNLTPQYYRSSRDFAFVDPDHVDVAAIESAFNSDWKDTQATAPRGRDLVWSPGSADVLLGLINAASTTLDIYNEEMADPRITSALEVAAERGVGVRVVMTYDTSWKAAFAELVQRGVDVRTYASSASFYIHAKAVIADDTRAFVGSENFSAQSLDTNRELGLLVSRPDLVGALEATFAHDWVGARPYKPATK